MGDISKGTTFAIAVLLFWLTGVCFWIAFTPATGEKIGDSKAVAGAGGVGELRKMIDDVTETNS